jgi:hypothetical protein
MEENNDKRELVFTDRTKSAKPNPKYSIAGLKKFLEEIEQAKARREQEPKRELVFTEVTRRAKPNPKYSLKALQKEIDEGMVPRCFAAMVPFTAIERLPTIPLEIVFYQDENDAVGKCMKIYALVDTGATTCFVCKDLLPPTLASHFSDNSLIQIEFRVAGTTKVYLTSALVREKQNMPNRASIFILGQYGALCRMVFTYRGGEVANQNSRINFISFHDSIASSDEDFHACQEDLSGFLPAQL